MAKLLSRTYRPGDELGIVRLYNRITGFDRTTAQHAWEWLSNPEGKGKIWVIVESATQGIVGHHGLIPLKMSYLGKTVAAGKTENTILHPRYLGTGIYFLYEKRFLKEAQESFQILFTTAGYGTPGRIRRKLGYRPVGYYSDYFKFIDSRGTARFLETHMEKRTRSRRLRAPASRILPIMASLLVVSCKRPNRSSHRLAMECIKDIDAVSDEINRFWEENRKYYGITVERNAGYLKWRIFDNPYVDYHFIAARRHGRIVGYAILKSPRDNNAFGVVADLVAQEGDRSIAYALVREAEKFFKNSNRGIISFTALGCPALIDPVLRKSGFIPITKLTRFFHQKVAMKALNEKQSFLVRNLNGALSESDLFDCDNWYYTDLFTEGIT